MKVVAFNGSPRRDGNTSQSLQRVGDELKREGVEFEMVHVGHLHIHGCTACGKCAQNRDERCSLLDDGVNEAIQKMKDAEGILLGSPVYFSGIAGTMKCFLDRAFYVSSANGGLLRHKAGAAVVAVRRSGGVAVFDSLNHYINYAEMIQPGSNYWNVIHGRAPGEAAQDEEGQQVLRLLGRNMAWLIKALAAGAEKVPPPDGEKKVLMSFIR